MNSSGSHSKVTRMYRIRDECVRLTRDTGWVGGVERRKSDCRTPGGRLMRTFMDVVKEEVGR